MEQKEDIRELYARLCSFPEDVHKGKDTFYTYSHLNEVIAKAYSTDKEEFMTAFSLENCLALPDWAIDAVINYYKKHGLMKKMLQDYEKYVREHHIGGAGERNTRFGKTSVDDNVCMENLAICVSNLAIGGEAFEYMGDKLPRWFEESEKAHKCAFEYTLESDDSVEIEVQNFIDVYSDNHIAIRAGIGIDNPSNESVDRIREFIKGMNDTDFPMLLDIFKLKDSDSYIFELSYELNEDQIYDILEEEKSSITARDEAFSHVLFGISHNSVREILPMLLNVFNGTHSPEHEVALYEADEDEGYHYETPNSARYYFEHGILKDLFFENPEAVLEEIAAGGGKVLYDNFRQRCERRNIECRYKEDDFKVYPRTVDGKEIVRIVMPLPKKEYDCFEVDIVISRSNLEKDDLIMPYYFTVERGSASKVRYLCEWDENGEHYNHGTCTASIDETLREMLSWVN